MTDGTKIVCPHHPHSGGYLNKQWQMVCSKCGTFLYWAKPPGLLQRPTCLGCNERQTVGMFRVTAANGHDHVAWHCSTCQQYVKDGQRLWLPSHLVGEFLAYWSIRLPERNLPRAIGELPQLKDHTGEPCAICGATASEYNHFMPQAFRDDEEVAADWPAWDKLGAWLCDRHHKIWHAKVAPLTALAQMKREAIK